ncbi:MAG: hypothetical protein NC084_10770 [Bacteroides sp.]|nr:hypothetical protein [Eubacterium sp.]MCM1417547.1 hypothetical protein [Roseburia sp.]MCM1463177.1 hypothetical protein [Bacteroides sp.]
MAFDLLKGERVYVGQTAFTYFFGDYFSVFEDTSDVPRIYPWDMVRDYTERPQELSITTDDGEVYLLPKNAFEDNEQLIRCRSIAEGQLSADVCHVTQRIIPPKYNYAAVEPPEVSYSASGYYVEKDINSGSAANIYAVTAKYLWLVAAAVFILVFLILHAAVGGTETNWYYFLPISLFSGIGAAVIVCVILGIVSRFRYSDFVKHDVSSAEEIVLVVARDGFAATERCVYTGAELIPWKNASYQFETKTTIVVICKDKTVCWIPKRLFPKEIQRELATFVASNVQSK